MRVLCLAALLAMGLTACVELAPAPEGDVSLGFYQPAYPNMVQVPGYPVYYAPSASANYFFYDGLYWLYQHDNWYASSWYDGPWGFVSPRYVPYYVLRVPVRYYCAPPAYFRGWHENEPPRWDQRWGRDWEEHHRDWNDWNRRSVPPPVPLPTYQQRYAGDYYPRDADRQQAIREENYRYAPRDELTHARHRPPGQQGGPVEQPQLQAQVQPSPGMQRLQRRSPPASPPSQPQYPAPNWQREARPIPVPRSAAAPASPAWQPEQRQHRPKPPPETIPPPATDVAPPMQALRSIRNNRARIDQP